VRVRADQHRGHLRHRGADEPAVRPERQRRLRHPRRRVPIGGGVLLPVDGPAALGRGGVHGPAVFGDYVVPLLADELTQEDVDRGRVAPLCRPLRRHPPAHLRLEPRAVLRRHRLRPSRAPAGLHQDEEHLGLRRRPYHQRLDAVHGGAADKRFGRV
ncbi:MAG: Abortive infection protein, partial [uncultured Rubrobacteraceae bacterium]